MMAYQSFRRASTPADAVFKCVKGWKEKGKQSAWQQRALQTPPFMNDEDQRVNF